MPTEIPDKLLWIDLETTGLNPSSDDIIELALAITERTDDPATSHTEILDTYTAIYRTGRPISRFAPAVLVMHTNNGLLPLSIQAKVRANDPQAYTDIKLWLRGHFPSGTPLPITGANPGFDRRFLATHMQWFYNRLTDYDYDISSLRRLAPIIGLTPFPDPTAPTHRALDCIQNAIDTLIYFRSQISLAQRYYTRTTP